MLNANEEQTVIEFTSRSPEEVGFRLMYDGIVRYVSFRTDVKQLNVPHLLREAATYIELIDYNGIPV